MTPEKTCLKIKIVYPHEPLQEEYKFGLVMPVYNRPGYLRRCLKSLAQSDFLPSTIMLMIDDGSYNMDTIKLVEDFSMPQLPVVKIFSYEHRPHTYYKSLQLALDMLSNQYHCKYLAMLDSDTIQKPHWFSSMYVLYQLGKQNYREVIVSGFNAYPHRVHEKRDNFLIKKTIGGASMLFSAAFYRELVRACFVSVGWDWSICDAMNRKGYPFLVSRPSVIQHIGQSGLWARGYWHHDFAMGYSLVSNLRCLPVLIYYELRLFVVHRLKKVKNMIKQKQPL